MIEREGDVLVWDISHVMRLLKEHPSSQLVISRAIRFHHHIDTVVEPNPYMDSLINDFVAWTINSFQEVMVAEFNPHILTPQEITWFNLNQNARSELWRMLRPLAYNYSGSMVNLARANHLIYIYAQTN